MSAQIVKVQVKVSGVLQAHIYETWTFIRAFGRAETWSGYYKGAKVVTALLPGQIEGQLGSVRTTAIGSASYVEQLDALDNDSFIMKYKIVDHPSNTNPFPGSLFDFKATIKLHEVTRSPATFMEWTGEFETSPQEYAVMQQAVSELFEAGFQGLENCLGGLSAFAPAEPPQMQHQMVHGQHLSDISRNLGSMSLRPAGGHAMTMDPSAGATAFQHQRSYMGPASVVSEPQAPHGQIQGINESESASSLESSPHIPDRAPGGFHHQWTSGGSGQILTHIPKRFSVEQDHSRRQLRRGRSSIREQDPSAMLPHGQGSRHSASSLESIPTYHMDPQRPSLHREDLSLGSAVSETVTPGPLQDPVLQAREEFKASLLRANMTSVDSFKTADAAERRRRTSERSRAPVMDRVSERETANVEPAMPYTPAAQGVSPQNLVVDELDNLEWAKAQQQREIEAREAFQRKAGRLGPFSQAATPGGPFAAAAVSAPPIHRHLPRHASQHSLGSIGEVDTSEAGTRNGELHR